MSHTQEPEKEENGDEEEERVLPAAAIVAMRSSIQGTCSVKVVVGVEHCGEEAKGEGTNAKGHVKAGVAKALEAPSALRLWPLSWRSWWCL